MNATMQSFIGKLVTLAIALFVNAASQAQEVDTSDWVCEFCPFESGARSGVTIGAGSISDDSAYFGDASGYSEDGAYPIIDGDGSYASDDYRLDWYVEDLGLDSRFAELRGGKPGIYDYEVSYRQLPRHRYYTSDSIFMQSSANDLSLPSGWVNAPLTSGFTQLDSSLARRDIESERKTMKLGGSYLPWDRLTLSASFRREERDGVQVYGGSYFNQSSLLPGSFDYETDTGEFGIHYAGDRGFVSLDYYVSRFENSAFGLTWETPFTSSPGAEIARLARAPDSTFQQLALSGHYRVADQPTTLAFSLAAGTIDQDSFFLPYTTNSNLAAPPLPRASLNGDVDTMNIALSLTSRVFDKGRIKIAYRYDERDNRTAQDNWTRIIADTFLSVQSEMNIPYSYERAKFSVAGEYRLFDTVRISGGYDRKKVDRDFQEVAEQTEDSGWGRLRWRPNDNLQLTVRGGAAERDVDAYNETFATSLGQNPLLRKYNLAYRYRRFGEVTVTASLPETPVSLTVKGLYADDDYTQSLLGLLEGDELRLAADLSWMLSENTSVYLSGGYETMESLQAGSEQFSTPDWRAVTNDDFYTFGAGIHARQITDTFDIQLDYTRSDGTSEIGLDTQATGVSRFPDLESTFDYVRANLGWRYSDRMRIDLDLRYQRFESRDWALQGVDPATLPTILTLGADPYDDDVFIIGIGFQYLMGGTAEDSGSQ